MIELFYKINKEDADKLIKNNKVRSIKIYKNRINNNKKLFPIYLNKSQLNKLVENGWIRYNITCNKMKKCYGGNGLFSSLIKKIIPFAKNLFSKKIASKIATSTAQAAIEGGIKKAISGNQTIKIDEKSMNKINNSIDKINKSLDTKFNKLPINSVKTKTVGGSLLASIIFGLANILPSLLKKGKGCNQKRNQFFLDY